MAMVSVSQPHDNLRWFHAVYPDEQAYGPWHLGETKPGKTWPAGPGLCGYKQKHVVIGRHVTAADILDQEENFCPECLDAYRVMVRR